MNDVLPGVYAPSKTISIIFFYDSAVNGTHPDVVNDVLPGVYAPSKSYLLQFFDDSAVNGTHPDVVNDVLPISNITISTHL